MTLANAMRLSLLAGCIFVISSPQSTRAATGTWFGGTSAWEQNANWSGSSYPNGSGDNATLNAGQATITSNITLNSMNINNSSHVIVNGQRRLTVNSLSIPSNGFLDLNDSGMVINYSGTPPTAAVRAWYIDGFGGTGIFNTSAYNNGYLLGLVDNAAPGFGYTSFDGQPVAANALLLCSVVPGDANIDGVVNQADRDIVTAHQGLLSGAYWYQGDVNLDGQVTSDDQGIVDANFNRIGPTCIPEPAVGLCLGGWVLLLVRRNRR